MRTYLDEPLWQCPYVTQAWELPQQIQTNGLKDIAGIVAAKPIFNGDREDQVFIAIDEHAPGVFIAFQAALHQTVVGR